MCSNWIIPFIAGVFVGQEFRDAPKVRPYIEAGVRKIIQVSKDIFDNAKEAKEAKEDANGANEKKDEGTSRRSWWGEIRERK